MRIHTLFNCVSGPELQTEADLTALSGSNLTYRSRVEEEVARLPEDERQLLIVVGHHLGLEHLLR